MKNLSGLCSEQEDVLIRRIIVIQNEGIYCVMYTLKKGIRCCKRTALESSGSLGIEEVGHNFLRRITGDGI